MLLKQAMRVPEAWRMLRISMRPSRVYGVALVSFLVSLVITAFMFFAFCVGPNAADVMSVHPNIRFTMVFFNNFCVFMVIYQMFLWSICLPAIASSSVSQEFSIGTWIFQSTTPQPTRLLMLGKLLGSTGDVISASLAALPFLLLSVFVSEITMLGLLKMTVFIFAFSSFMACMFLYISCLIKYQKRNSMGAVLLIPLLVLFSLPMLPMSGNAVGYLHPVAAFQEFLFSSAMKSGMTAEFLNIAPVINFFGATIPVFPFTIAFYCFLAVWFFVASEGQMMEKMGVPGHRFYMLFLIGSFNFVFVGLIFNFDLFTHKNDMMLPVVMLTIINVAMIYSALFLHTRSRGELRPWLYGLPSSGFSIKYLFKDSAPMFFTALALLVIYALSISFLSFFPARMEYVKLALPIQILTVSVIVLRDALFFQFLYLRWKKPLFAGVAIYLIGFAAVPLLMFITNYENPVLDLTPLTALITTPLCEDLSDQLNYIITYILSNGVLTIGFAALCWIQFRRMINSFKTDIKSN